MVAMVVLMLMMFSSYLLPVAFMPDISERLGVSKAITGAIISIFPAGSVVATMVIGKYQSRIGKLVIINYLSYFTFVSMMMFGLALGSSNKAVYIGLSSAARFLQGLAVGGICAILYSFCPLLFEDRQHMVLSYLEMSVGLGMSCGTLVGNLFFRLLGSPDYTFYFFAVLYIVLMKTCVRLLPDLKSSEKKAISFQPFLTDP